MRVALFSSTIEVTNGYGNITFEYCRSLQGKGVDFVLFLPRSESKLVRDLGLSYRVKAVLPPYIFRIKPWNFLPYLLPPSVRDFDLVHSLFDFPYCVSAALSAQRAGKPFLMGVQGTYGVLPLTYPIERFFLMWAYRRTEKIIVPSQFTKEKILTYAKTELPITVIHNGVNWQRFTRHVVASYFPSLEAYAGKRILLTVGGLKTRKGQDLVIRALAKLSSQFSNLVYLVVGEGELRNEYEALVRELALTERVFFLGNKVGDELVALFDRADIFILTPKVVSDTVFEGFGIVYLEASARRKAIIATDAGGVRDAVIHGQTGLVVPDGDVEAISEAIDRLLRDEALRKTIGEAGYEYAKRHDWAKIADEYLKVYERALIG